MIGGLGPRKNLMLLVALLLLGGCNGLWYFIPAHKDPADKDFVVGTWYWDYKNAGRRNLTLDDAYRFELYEGGLRV
jgi:hypothetical protein